MTDAQIKNRNDYLELVRTTYSFNEESMKFMEERTSDEWKPLPEFQEIINNADEYVDQRAIYNVDLSNKDILNLFKNSDNSYSLFKNIFSHILDYYSDNYGNISYEEFVKNKITWKKNTVKIKKVFEEIYKDHPTLFERDASQRYDEKTCADFIVKAFERIGASKKSAKKVQLVVSFNPIDWLLASTSESFSSCFNINNSDGGYKFSLGLPFLAGDPNRMMIYITNGSKKKCMGIEVDSVQTRTWCILGNDNKFHIVKWYPNDTIGVEPVKNVTRVSAFADRTTFQKGKYPLKMLTTKLGIYFGVYLDMGTLKYQEGNLWMVGNDKGCQQIFASNGVELQHSNLYHTYSFEPTSILRNNDGRFGYRIPLWREAGITLDSSTGKIICRDCGKESGGFYVDHKYYCPTCYSKKVYICSVCHNNKMKNGKESLKKFRFGEDYVCPDCLKQYESHICDICGNYSEEISNTVDNKKICADCLAEGREGYFKCECNKISNKGRMTYNQFTRSLTKRCMDCDTSSEETYATFGRKYRILTRNISGGAIE